MTRQQVKAFACLVATLVVGGCSPAATAVRSAADRPTPGTTIVSLTFDDGYAEQLAAVEILAEHRLRGTFYINDGVVGQSARFMSWRQIRSLAAAGHEIGGHTIDHPHLSQLGAEAQRHEICDDRATLLKLGFSVASFAYPYGETDPPAESVVKSCGYNSGRDVSGLVNGGDCSDCPLANPLPVPDPYRIRGNSSTSTLALYKQYVTQAGRAKGKVYVPLTFHHVCEPCTGPPTDERISPRDFDTFVTWLKDQQSVQVKTVHEVIGGPLRPAVGTPVQSTLRRAAGDR
jgi:peptidoglycan/xylan/chitin deacetylase (PgdA/CDA1 family)